MRVRTTTRARRQRCGIALTAAELLASSAKVELFSAAFADGAKITEEPNTNAKAKNFFMSITPFVREILRTTKIARP